MSEQSPTEPGQPQLTPPEHSLQPAPPPGYTPAPPAWAPPPPPQRPSFWNRIAAFIVLIAVVAAAAGAGIGWSLARAVNGSPVAQNTAQPEAPIQPLAPGNSPSSGSTSTSSIASKVRPAIVDINTTVGNNQAAGTGMIISSTGEILTNNHVVASSTTINVTLQGRSQNYTAHVVAVDESQDVAVLQIDQSVSGLPTVQFASSSSVKVGDAVVALGNALGQGGAPAHAGTVTDLNQTITASEGGGQSETLNGMIESDALIYSGDSGGALVNASGQVVGMITAGQAQGFRSSASSVGYAIASDTFLSVVNRIRAHEQASDLTYGQVGYLGVQVDQNSTGGAQIVGVVPGSPAASAGITSGSTITKLGGTSIDNGATLGTAIKSHKPGSQVSVTWLDRNGGSHTTTVTVGGINP